MKRVCFFHRADLDGKCAAAIVREHFKGEVELVGVNYGDDYEEMVFSKIDSETVAIMVDFTMQPWELMVRLNESCHFIWIDHHIEAIKQYDNWMEYPDRKIDGCRCDGIAGCSLTWRYFNTNKRMPKFVELLGLYDVWKWKNVPDAIELQMGMRMEENWPNCKVWHDLLIDSDFQEVEFRRVVNQGRVIVKYQQQQNKIHVKSAAFILRWRDMTWVAINEMYNNSTLFDSVYDPKKHHGMLTFGWRAGNWHFSLYTQTPGVDVGSIATAVGKELKTGGGGHKNAAGFQAKELPFDLRRDIIKWGTELDVDTK